ncbi:MAG: hypothetical protein PUP92_16945 [Rhizonema sp. PD38]|nr:hypothetical protein [Rhizonema sp. PD38]
MTCKKSIVENGLSTRLPKRFPKTPKLTVVHLKSIWQFGNYFTQHKSIV